MRIKPADHSSCIGADERAGKDISQNQIRHLWGWIFREKIERMIKRWDWNTMCGCSVTVWMCGKFLGVPDVCRFSVGEGLGDGGTGSAGYGNPASCHRKPGNAGIFENQDQRIFL